MDFGFIFRTPIQADRAGDGSRVIKQRVTNPKLHNVGVSSRYLLILIFSMLVVFVCLTIAEFYNT
jgi:hypothetical protein